MDELAIYRKVTKGALVNSNIEQKFTNSLTPSTKAAYLVDIKQFFNVLSLNEITVDMIRRVDVDVANAYFESLIDKGFKITTVNRKMTSLRYFFHFVSRRDINLIEFNPFSTEEGCRRFKNTRNYSNTRCLTSGEIKKLFAITNENTITNTRDKLIIMLLATTGMRREEIVSIRIGDIVTNSGRHCAEIIGKGDKVRFIVFSQQIYELIGRYLSMRGLDFNSVHEYLVVNHAHNYENKSLSMVTIFNVIKKYSGHAGIDPETVSPHSLRHSFITISLESGATLEDVQDMVGHACSSTTRRYDHINRVINHSTAETLTELFTGH